MIVLCDLTWRDRSLVIVKCDWITRILMLYNRMGFPNSQRTGNIKCPGQELVLVLRIGAAKCYIVGPGVVNAGRP